MSDSQQGPGWWIASDGRWYPPEAHPDYVPPAPETPAAPPPPPSQAPAPPGTPPPPGPPTPEGPAQKPWWKKKWVLAVAAILVVIVIAGILANPDDTGDSDSEIVTSPEPTEALLEEPSAAPTEGPAAEPTEAAAEEPTEQPVEAPTAEPTAPPEPTEPPIALDDGCRYLGVDDFGDMQVEITATSPFDALTDMSIDFALLDGDGVRFATEFTAIDSVRPGETVRIPTDTLESLPGDVDESQIECSILSVEDFGFSTLTAAAPSDSCEYLGLDDFGDMQVRIDIQSPFNDTGDLVITIGMYDRDGTRFATPVEFVDLVGAGEAVRTDVDTLTDIPDSVTEPDAITCEVLSFDQF